MKVALEVQSTEVEHLRELLQKEEQVAVRLKAALTLAEEKKKKLEEEVDDEREQAVEAFRSSKAIEDIKIAFA